MAHDAAPRRILTVPEGALLYAPGQECPGFVVVHEGTVKVALTAENGREIVLYRVRPGDICLQTFGCLVNGSTYSAQATAESAVAVEIIPAAEFQRRVSEDEPFRKALFAAVATRFADLERLVEDVALSSIEVRLARALLRLADDGGIVHATHETLATEIGSAREVVSRQLAAFARAGMIAGTRGHTAITNRQALRQLAAEHG